MVSLLTAGSHAQLLETLLALGLRTSRGGLSPHPAEPGRGDSVEAEAEVSEAAESKQCPEGRGGRNRPV